MSELLTNLAEFVKMIFGVLVTPNYGANNENLNILRYLFIGSGGLDNAQFTIRAVLSLTFGIMLAGVSIGILKRFLWKS